MKRLALASTLLIAATSLAFAQEAPPLVGPPVEPLAQAPAMASPPPPPPPARARPESSTDEGGLWGVSDRAEQQARASGQLETDPALNAYVRDVACRVAAEYCGDIRLYIMNRPFFNASMAPNGYMEVWSGLLLRAEDEAQLAFVLGHETAHYGERHSLEALRATRARATGAMIASVVIAAAGTAAAVNSPNSASSISDVTRIAVDAVYLGTIASLFGFSRENETEADNVGFDHAVAANYDPSAGHRIWTSLMAETAASDNPDTRRRETRGSIFSTHPLSAERVEALSARAAAHSGTGQTHRERYRAVIRPFLDEWLRADLRRRDYGQTAHLLNQLAAHGEDLGVIEYYRGEICRLRRAEGDRASALQHYANAIAHADAPAAAWRELGEFAARDGRHAEAAAHFTTYLERAPNAEDRALVEARLAQINAQTGGVQ